MLLVWVSGLLWVLVWISVLYLRLILNLTLQADKILLIFIYLQYVNRYSQMCLAKNVLYVFVLGLFSGFLLIFLTILIL